MESRSATPAPRRAAVAAEPSPRTEPAARPSPAAPPAPAARRNPGTAFACLSMGIGVALLAGIALMTWKGFDNRAERESLSQRVEVAEEQSRTAKERAADAERRLTETESAARARANELVAELESFQKKLADKTAKQDALTIEKTRLALSLAQFEQANAGLGEERQGLLASQAKLEAELAARTLDAQKVQSQLEAILARAGELAAALQELQGLRKSLETLTGENAALGEELRRTSQNLARAEMQAEKFRLQRDLFEHELLRLSPKPAEGASAAPTSSAPAESGAAANAKPDPAAKTPEPEPKPAPALEANVVVAADKDGIVVIDAGLDRGLAKGARLWILRGGEPIAIVSADRLQRQLAGCSIVSRLKETAVREGDTATTRQP